MNAINLTGCRAEPLLSYLAGLGVLRLLAEQFDPDISASWDGDRLAIAGPKLNRVALLDFFVYEYSPTPLIAPWNGRGGFQDDKERASERIIKKVESAESVRRLDSYRIAIKVARDTWEEARDHQLIVDGKITNKNKAQFVRLCRARFPDDALLWLDASAVLLDEDMCFPLILGTGGNLGSMDLSFTFLRTLDSLGILDAANDCTNPDSKSLIDSVLFGNDDVKLLEGSTGQFDPGGLGGPNSSSAGDGKTLVNPWNFVLAMEGALVFASAAARRLGAGSQYGSSKASMPFTVDATVAGYSSSSRDESPKGELWAPLWRDWLSYREVRHLMAEGRSQWGRNQSRSGLDFIRAAKTLGVDRSVGQFVRYLLSERNGQSVLAVPIGRYKVADHKSSRVDLLRQLDSWVNQARSSAAPVAVSVALSTLERAQFEVARLDSPDGGPVRLQNVLVELARTEQALSLSRNYRGRKNLKPVSGLNARDWVPLVNDRSVEFRIAVSLASLSDKLFNKKQTASQVMAGSIITLLRPVVRVNNRFDWSNAGPRVPNLGRRPLAEVLSDVATTRAASVSLSKARSNDQEKVTGLPFSFDYGFSLSLSDLSHFLFNQVDEKRLSSILSGLLLLDWKDSFPVVNDSIGRATDHDAWWQLASEPSYVVLAPFFMGVIPVPPTEARPNPDESPILARPRPEWIGALRAGNSRDPAKSAAKILRGHGWHLIPDQFDASLTVRKHLLPSLLIRVSSSEGRLSPIRLLLDVQSKPINKSQLSLNGETLSKEIQNEQA